MCHISIVFGFYASIDEKCKYDFCGSNCGNDVLYYNHIFSDEDDSFDELYLKANEYQKANPDKIKEIQDYAKSHNSEAKWYLTSCPY